VPDSSQTSFATTLDEAMRKRHLTLSELSDRLQARGHSVSLASLSYWRAGQREPIRRRSLEAVPEIEQLLNLPTGTLSNRLSLAPRGPAPHAFDELVGHVLPEPLTGEVDVDRVLFHMVVDIGTRREVVRARITQVFVARRDDVDGITIFVGPDPEVEDNDVVLRPLAGCSIDEVRDTDGGIRATRLCFERPLRKAESVVIEYEAAVQGRLDLDTEYGLVAEQRLEEAMVWVRFSPDCLPSRAWVWFEEDGLRHDWPVDLDGATGIHYRQTTFGPGVLAARWEW